MLRLFLDNLARRFAEWEERRRLQRAGDTPDGLLQRAKYSWRGAPESDPPSKRRRPVRLTRKEAQLERR